MAPRTLTSKFAGTCQRCRRPFPAGTVIVWAKNAGATHADTQVCAAAAATPAPPTAPVAHAVNLKPIADFLTAAKDRAAALAPQWRKAIMMPKARFLAPGGRGELRLSLSGNRSKAPGSIQVTIGNDWMGRVEPDGRAVGQLATDPALIDTLLMIASNPVEAAQAYGAFMCKCSFCGLPLTDDGSVEVGYGPQCAKKFGLPHQPRGTRAVGEVAGWDRRRRLTTWRWWARTGSS